MLLVRRIVRPNAANAVVKPEKVVRVVRQTAAFVNIKNAKTAPVRWLAVRPRILAPVIANVNILPVRTEFAPQSILPERTPV